MLSQHLFFTTTLVTLFDQVWNMVLEMAVFPTAFIPAAKAVYRGAAVFTVLFILNLLRYDVQNKQFTPNFFIGRLPTTKNMKMEEKHAL